MCACVRACVRAWVRVCVGVYVCARVHACAFKYSRIHTYSPTYTNAHKQPIKQTHTHSRTHARTHAHTHTHTVRVCIIYIISTQWSTIYANSRVGKVQYVIVMVDTYMFPPFVSAIDPLSEVVSDTVELGLFLLSGFIPAVLHVYIKIIDTCLT